jgi:putative ABC transport system permease protein
VLLVLGMLCGTASAALAVWPSLSSTSSGLPLGIITALLAGVLVFGLVICAVAVWAALRGSLLDALRKE